MKKVLIPAIFFLLLLLVSNARAYEQLILDDHFARSSCLPWVTGNVPFDAIGTCTPPSQCTVTCSATYSHLNIEMDNPKYLGYAVIYPLSTQPTDFNWWINLTEPNSGLSGYFIAEWSGEEGATLGSVRFYKPLESDLTGYVEISTHAIISDVSSGIYPWGYSCRSDWDYYPYADNWVFNITKTGTTVKVYVKGLSGWDEIGECTHAAFAGHINNLFFGMYNHDFSDSRIIEQTKFYATSQPKIEPTLTISVAPAYNNTVGTQTTVSCVADYPVPVTLSYFGNITSNPDVRTLPLGQHWYYCDSPETADYYSAHAVHDLWIHEVEYPVTTTMPIPSQILNASQPIPQFVNETEWREAGYGWALIFVSPLGLITFVTLIFSAGMAKLVGQPSGVYFGIIAFIFLWLLLVMFTGILPTWIFLVIMVIAGFIVAQVAKKII